MKDKQNHTLNILKIFYSDLPPLVPLQVKERMENILKQTEEINLDEQEAEKIVIFFGKFFWPYWQAFEDLLNEHKTELGEQFFIDGLDHGLKNKYREMRQNNFSFNDVCLGRNLNEFSPRERVKISYAIVASMGHLKNFVRQKAIGVGQSDYLKNIKKYHKISKKIEKELENLRGLAYENKKQDPDLTEEIEEKVNFFERSMSKLAPKIVYNDVFNAYEFFLGRKKDKLFLN